LSYILLFYFIYSSSYVYPSVSYTLFFCLTSAPFGFWRKERRKKKKRQDTIQRERMTTILPRLIPSTRNKVDVTETRASGGRGAFYKRHLVHEIRVCQAGVSLDGGGVGGVGSTAVVCGVVVVVEEV
jgi:hypothetical protein